MSMYYPTYDLQTAIIDYFAIHVVYTYWRGLRRCSFRQMGNARASERGTSDKEIPTLFLCVVANN